MNDIDPPGKASPSLSPLRDREWDKLLSTMRKGDLIPVIGSELMTVPGESGSQVRLYDLWGQTLAEQRSIPLDRGDEDAPLLYRVANRLSVDPDMPLGDLEYDINDVICNNAWPMPQALQQLAKITDFPIYLTTTVDHLLESALAQERGAPLSIAFKRGGGAADTDLPESFEPRQRPTVFYLFGKSCTDRDAFAATEDALIDFSWALIDQTYAPSRLYDFLRDKTLLLLGCNFPDWLGRFFVHALTRKSDAGILVMYVSERRMTGFCDFLRRKKARPPVTQSPAAFVAEMHRRWRTGQGLRPSMESVKPGAVFISYAREDLDIARKVRAQLDHANVDTWMDESGLEPGDEFKPVIRENIEKASFFLALISRSLDIHGQDHLGRFVLREWKWAEDAAEARLTDDRFLQPVIVDDTKPDAGFLDRPFRGLAVTNWTRLENGELPASFIDSVKRGIRRFRSGGGAR